jgi:hypothetical protein
VVLHLLHPFGRQLDSFHGRGREDRTQQRLTPLFGITQVNIGLAEWWLFHIAFIHQFAKHGKTDAYEG